MTGWRLPQRVAYVVNHSYPYSSDGYAVRTHEVARALSGLGHDMVVLNRPGRPWDIEGFRADAPVSTEQIIDGVRYLFLPNPPVGTEMNRRGRLRQAEAVLTEAFEILRPGAVMAVSNWENAEPAQYAARRWGCAFFYEQRGFWEMARAAGDATYAASPEYQADQQNDVRVAQAAQVVFTLNAGMRAELIRRGVAGDKIQLVANGISPPVPVAATGGITRAAIGCQAKHLLGYVGSLNAYEGGEDLLQLVAQLRASGVDVDLLMLGSGAPKGLIGSQYDTPVATDLRAQAEALKIAGHVHFVPQMAQSETGAYYSLLDAVIMPRRRTPVTELVAPLKPYAAAAYGVPVFMSDLPPLAEVAQDIEASLFPEGDIDALAGMVRHMLEQGDHPAAGAAPKPGLLWSRRVQPMSRHLQAAAQAAPRLEAQLGQAGAAPAEHARFDTHILPRVALSGGTVNEPVAVIGPCAYLPGQTHITRLSRVNILSELAQGPVGRFIIDWAGLQDAPGDWDGLWSVADMRLNRLVLDACRIALDRGWRMQVVGPVLRSRAPLYRTVSGAFEEISPVDDDSPEGAS